MILLHEMTESKTVCFDAPVQCDRVTMRESRLERGKMPSVWLCETNLIPGSVFLPLVPSLSWQMIAFHAKPSDHQKAFFQNLPTTKRRFFSPTWYRPVACLAPVVAWCWGVLLSHSTHAVVPHRRCCRLRCWWWLRSGQQMAPEVVDHVRLDLECGVSL